MNNDDRALMLDFKLEAKYDDIEAAIIGAIIIDPECVMPELSANLPAEYLSSKVYRPLYEAALGLWQRGIAPYEELLQPEVIRLYPENERYLLQELYPCRRVAEFQDAVNRIDDYIATFADDHQLDQIRQSCGRISSICRGKQFAPADVLIEWQKELDAYNRKMVGAGDADIQTAGDFIVGAGRHIGRHQGISTGIPDIDEMSGGFKPQEVWTIAAKTGTGKSRIDAYMACRVASQVPTAIINLEMANHKFAEYVCSTLGSLSGTGLTPRDLFSDPSSPMLKTRWAQVAKGATNTPIYLIDQPQGCTAAQLKNYCRRLALEGVQVIFIDQAQRLAEFRAGQTGQNRGAIGEVFHLANDIASKNGVTVALLHQLNRAGYEEPTLASLYESATAEHVAAHVLFFHDKQRQLVENPSIGAFKYVHNKRGQRIVCKPKESDWTSDDVNILEVVENPRPITAILAKTRGERTGNTMMEFHFGWGVQVAEIEGRWAPI